MERSVPWWRRALEFALSGIRSGFGLFRRNGKPQSLPEEEAELEIEAALEDIAEPGIAPPGPEDQTDETVTEEPIEETELKNPSPESEAAAETTQTVEPPAVHKPGAPAVEEQSAEPPAAREPEPAAPVVPTVEEKPVLEAANVLKGHDFSRAVAAANSSGTLAPEGCLSEISPEPEAAAETAEVVVADPPETASESTEAGTEPASAAELASAAVPAPAGATELSETPHETGSLPATQEPDPAAEPSPIAEVAEESATEAADPVAAEEKIVPPVVEAQPAETETAGKEQSAEVAPLEIQARAESEALPVAPPEAAAANPVEAIIEPEPVEEPAPENASPTEPSPEPEAASKELEKETAPQAEPVPAPAAEAAPADPAPTPPQDPAPTLPFAEKSARQTTAEKVAAALKARGEDAEQSPFSVLVNQVYDGPLDLLLDLIRKQDIDIYDIPIAKITAQFLAYVDRLRASDMDVAGDFIYTAALLIHIKSKMLLPRAPSGPEEQAEDPRRELVERLLEHERFKNAAQMLLEKQMLEAASWTNPGVREFREDSEAEPEIAADTTDLVRIFSGILERARNRPIINVEEDSITVGQMIQFLSRRLTMEDKPIALRRLLSHTHSERALIAMFLALLELVRLQAVLLRQDRHFSEIFIKKNTGFEAAMNSGLAEARDDWR